MISSKRCNRAIILAIEIPYVLCRSIRRQVFFINTLNRAEPGQNILGNQETQLLNFFNIDDKLRLVDVPGYTMHVFQKKKRAREREVDDWRIPY